MHIKRSIEVVKAVLLEVVVQKGTSSSARTTTTIDVQVHLHVGITAVVYGAQVRITVRHIVRKECALIQISPLVHALLRGRVELHHHG